MDSEWIKWSDRQPARLTILDALYAATRDNPSIWIRCGILRSVFIGDGEPPEYWRPALALPDEIDAVIIKNDDCVPRDWRGIAEYWAEEHLEHDGHNAELAPVETCPICAGLLVMLRNVE